MPNRPPTTQDEDELLGQVKRLKQMWIDRIDGQTEVQAHRTLDELAGILRGLMGQYADSAFVALLLRDLRQSTLAAYYASHERSSVV